MNFVKTITTASSFTIKYSDGTSSEMELVGTECKKRILNELRQMKLEDKSVLRDIMLGCHDEMFESFYDMTASEFLDKIA